MRPKGFFDLQTPEHLLAKAHRDYARLRENPHNSDAAFDFFVAARHVPDWLEATGRARVEECFARHVQLRICRHIADGAKHFQATHPRHKQVEGTSISFAAWVKTAWAKGTWAKGAWAEDELLIELDPADPETKIYGRRIAVGPLAEDVLRILENLIQAHPPAT